MDTQIINVLPLSKSLPKDLLTYFSKQDISLGDIVEIPIKKQLYKGLVVGIDNAKHHKGRLKELAFSLRPIKKSFGVSPFSPLLLTMATKLQEYHLGSLSEHIDQLIPRIFIENINTLRIPPKHNESATFSRERLIFQAHKEDRISHYKTLIRESFARKQSVRFVVPTIQDAEELMSQISKGIQDHSIVLHSKKTKKQILEAWNKIQTEEHPLCLVHTPAFLSIPRHDTETLILEHEHKTSYRSIKKPFLDGRITTELFARLHNYRLIMGDELLRTETLIRHFEGELGSIGTPSFRIYSPAEHTVIDARTEARGSFEVIHRDGWEIFDKAQTAKEKVFVFTLKSNIASITVCQDCGTTLTKEGIPLELHEDKHGKRFFKNRHTNQIFDSNQTCGNCGSWNLVALGLGTERVYQEIREHYPNSPILLVDHNHNNTPETAKKAVEDFLIQEEGGFLIGSPFVLPFLPESAFPTSYIVSIDTLFAIPHYNMYEQIMHLVTSLSHKSSRHLYIQTRHKDQKITGILESKKLVDFFTYDYTERKEWGYPPFTTILKLGYEGPKKDVILAEHYLEKKFKDQELFVYHSAHKNKDYLKIHAVLKIPKEDWRLPWIQKTRTSEEIYIREILASLSNDWNTIVNPHNLL